MSAIPYERFVISVLNAVMFASPVCMSLIISRKVTIKSCAYCCAVAFCSTGERPDFVAAAVCEAAKVVAAE